MSTLVTGDAVVLELPPAGLGARFLGILIDYVAYLGGLFGIALALAPLTDLGDSDANAAVALTISVATLVLVPTVVETLSRGRSLGKLAMGLRVVRDDGGAIRTRHALARQLVGFFEIFVTQGVFSVFAVLFSPRGKRFGDMLAGTYVISERTPLIGSPMPVMPPQLAEWAQLADVGRIPPAVALSGRTFLSRVAAMTPAAAADLGRTIAGELAGLVSPRPPEGTSDVHFIAAVLAERRRRDLLRLASERAQLDRLRGITDRRRDRV